MKGFTSVWCIRVGTHRVICEINDGLVLVTVIRVGRRKNLYSGM